MELEESVDRLWGHTPGLMGGGNSYAVLVPLVKREGEEHLLFEVRADTLSRQPGEVCFPGGRMEPGENPEECALRETGEELGIPARDIQILAPLDFLFHQSGFLLYPVLARVDKRAAERLTPGSAEVKETFLVPLSFFRENPPRLCSYRLKPDVPEDFPYDLIGFPEGYAWKDGRVEVPIYQWEGHAIWGLTGRIVKWLMEQLEQL